MPLITWTEALSVGVVRLDAQHQALIAMINDLHESMLQGKGAEVLRPTLDKLVAYTKTHFAQEEDLFKRHGYAGAAAHKQQHDDLTAKVVALQADLRAGKPALSVATMQFLKDWLTKHILSEDMQYRPFFKQKGIV